MHVEWVRIGASDLLSVRGETGAGEVGAQMTALLTACEKVLQAEGLSVLDVVFQRMFLRSRAAREEASLARGAFFSGNRRGGSSSFQSAARFAGPGDAMIEILALRPMAGKPKRLVEFAELRKYPQYVVHDDLMFVSGMAELAATPEEQLQLSIAQVEAALAAEMVAWRDVIEARTYVQKGSKSPAWLRSGLDAAAKARIPRVVCEQVDGLATEGKVLEIEVVVRKPA